MPQQLRRAFCTLHTEAAAATDCRHKIFSSYASAAAGGEANLRGCNGRQVPGTRQRISFDFPAFFPAFHRHPLEGYKLMFTPSNSPEPMTLEPLKPAPNGGVHRPPQARSGPSGDSSGKSVISNDLKIIGQGLKIISRGTLQVDGEVEGDVAG